MTRTVEEIIGHLRKPFMIKEDGTSQTELSNHGRVGFHLERLFGITPNNDRRPDLGSWELKTFQLGKKISIGTMPEEEFQRIKQEPAHLFAESDPYKKMKNTLCVVYTKTATYPEPYYVMNGWGFLNLEKMSDRVKAVLQEDYEFICNYITARCNNRDEVTNILQCYGSVSGDYLTLSYKGQGYGGYNYPAWGFQSKFMKMMSHA